VTNLFATTIAQGGPCWLPPVPAIPLMPWATFSSVAAEEADPWLGTKVWSRDLYAAPSCPLRKPSKGLKRVGLKYVLDQERQKTISTFRMPARSESKRAPDVSVTPG